MTSVYVASSWRNELQQDVVHELRRAGFDVYDFKNPPGATGFSWSQIGLEHSKPLGDNSTAPDLADADHFLDALDHPRAHEGFNSDFDAMQAADIIVMVLPCGRSAHLELGWGIGANKTTAILLDNPCTPELMYLAANHISTDLRELIDWLSDLSDWVAS